MSKPSWFTCCALTSIAILWLTGCEMPWNDVTSPAPTDSTVDGYFEAFAASSLGEPFARLAPDELARFDAGADEFAEVDTIAEGLGPVFNEASCGTCHTGPVGGTNNRLETRFGRIVAGAFDPMVTAGGSLIQDHAIGKVGDPPTYEFVAEAVPGDATIRASRITTPLFGLGLVDAVPDEELLRLANLQATRTPATAGSPSLVLEISSGHMRVGRFGWKAQVPTLHQFSGDAYLNEMGITNPEFPDENCPQGDCDALSHRVFRPFSDFLLHDMGSLGDSIVQGSATGSQMRTAPLWGVRTRTALLHDGRAATIDAAIRAHDGQGRLARDLFLGLGSRARAALLAFVNSL